MSLSKAQKSPNPRQTLPNSQELEKNPKDFLGQRQQYNDMNKNTSKTINLQHY